MARAFAAHWVANVLRAYPETRNRLSAEVLEGLLIDSGCPGDDINRRLLGGLAAGELLKAVYALAGTAPALASLENAIRLYEISAGRSPGCRTTLLAAKRQFESVAHLWCAWVIRDGNFGSSPKAQYDGWDDFQCLITESEILRDFGQFFRRPVANSKPFLPAELWSVPQEWLPPIRRPDWPNTGMVPRLSIPDKLLRQLKLPGRPRGAQL